MEGFSEDGSGVGADGEKGGVPEGYLAGITGQQVQAERHQDVDEQTGHHIDDVVVDDVRQGQQRRTGDHQYQTLRAFGLLHTFPASPDYTPPERPGGFPPPPVRFPCGGADGGAEAYTFFMVMAPNRPLGFTINTRMRRIYVETCLIPALKKYPERFSRTPNSMPPTMAPGMLPKPPRIAPANALTAMMPRLGSR